MTAQLLSTELSTLLQETKRKNPELKSAAEKSLSDLKHLPRTSELQIAADLRSRLWFARPFLLACGTRNPKFAGSGIIGLQRLVISNALPKDTLTDVLEAFRECSSLALDIQLKVLQALPSLLQNYSSSLTGPLLITAFQVCFLLYSSKTAVVSNTAAAALQQLVSSTLEKATEEDAGPLNKNVAVEVAIGDGNVSVHGAALDAHHVLEDICLLTDGQRPRYLLTASLVQNFGLELLESVLVNHADTVSAHPEQIHILRLRLMPLIIKVLSERASFSTTVRTMRLLQLIVGRLLVALAPECEMALSLLNHMLDPDAAAAWKRALCLEVFRTIHADPALMRSIYGQYDCADEKRNIVRDHLGTLVRLASERPAMIGLGQYSSIPNALGETDDSGDQAAVQAGGLVGSIGGSVTAIDMDRPGISKQWSTVRIPCIDMLDKSEAPHLPATYIYSLALTCVTSFSEGLARFLLPFTVPHESRSKRKKTPSQEVTDNRNGDEPSKKKLLRTLSYGGRRAPVNPLTLESHTMYSQISTSGHMVEHCWPALLAASSTYLNATLDSEFYHALIRSFQKFTQIAGLLDLVTPRDAFLTTLGKHAVPAMNSTAILPSSSERRSSDDLADSDRDSSPAPSVQRQSTDLEAPTMNPRHLLCLRALLNLGIALGPVLTTSWTIILDVLLQADLVLSFSNSTRRKNSKRFGDAPQNETIIERTDSVEDLGLEITAAETAASRLFETTSDLSVEAFLGFLNCLCSLLQANPPAETLLSPKPDVRKHRKVRSTSGFNLEGGAVSQSNSFVINKINDVIQSNIVRLLQTDTSESGWDVLVEVLNNAISTRRAQFDVRIKAANTLNDLFVATAISEEPLSSEERDAVRGRSLDAMLGEILALRNVSDRNAKSVQNCEIEIHRLTLESLRTILEHCGDSLGIGWTSVLTLINTVFAESSHHTPTIVQPSPRVIRSAFDSLQLICSDFLASVPFSHLLTLLDTLHTFCAQSLDLNISLTTATFFRNISDYLQHASGSINVESLGSINNSDLTTQARDNDAQKSAPALWIHLLLRLELLSTDTRLEVRHSALHTLFRIFDACFDQLTVSSAQICFSRVLVKLLEGNEEEHDKVSELARSETSDRLKRGWNETAIVELEGITGLFSQWLLVDKRDGVLADTCQNLFGHFITMLKRRILNVSNAVFDGASKMIAVIEIPEKLGRAECPMLEKAWEMCETNNPALHIDDSERQRMDNQDALLAYIKVLNELLRLAGPTLPLRQLEVLLKELRDCVVDSTASAYSTDVDRMTSVQGLVLKTITAIPTTQSDAAPQLIRCIAGFETLAYEQEGDAAGPQQTYVALSKAAMTMMESLVIEHLPRLHVDAVDLVSCAGAALVIPIQLKYKWRPEGKGMSPWKKATLTALAILEAGAPIIISSNADVAKYWEVVVNINNGIICADYAACVNPTEIPNDCDFDIEAFARMKRLVIPALGSSNLADAIRRRFAESLFRNSIIHEPHIDDLARPGQELLEGLRSTHIGRVNDLPPSRRTKLSYSLLDELFSLVAVQDGSPEQVKLAQAAAPFLILRAGLTLKAYMMDHPLRGRMPQPLSQKKEMFYILRKLIELDSEPKAIPAASGISSEYKKHLHRLYPFVTKALKAAWRDEEMTAALQDFLDAVGDDFGV